MPKLGDIATLVRLPAVLSVPGDSLLGAAASGARRSPARTAGMAGASCALYLAGMALNDWADRDVDAVERPERPIPSGRVSARFALGLSAALTATGLGLAAASGGRSALRVAAPLAATVWAYDLKLKQTPAGPAAMTAARSLDVLLGACEGPRRAQALVAAGVVGAHSYKITSVSAHEVPGGPATVPKRALGATAAISAAGLGVAFTSTARGQRLGRLGAAVGLIGAYGLRSSAAERAAVADPSPGNLQRVVGTGVLGFLPLEAGLHAVSGPPAVTVALAAGWRLARRLAAKRAVT
jgi:hypothetical protein